MKMWAWIEPISLWALLFMLKAPILAYLAIWTSKVSPIYLQLVFILKKTRRKNISCSCLCPFLLLVRSLPISPFIHSSTSSTISSIISTTSTNSSTTTSTISSTISSVIISTICWTKWCSMFWRIQILWRMLKPLLFLVLLCWFKLCSGVV